MFWINCFVHWRKMIHHVTSSDSDSYGKSINSCHWYVRSALLYSVLLCSVLHCTTENWNSSNWFLTRHWLVHRTQGLTTQIWCFGSTSTPLISSDILSRRTRQSGILHDILAQLWIDHPEPVHSLFQHPIQKLHGRLVWLWELHVPQEYDVSYVLEQLFLLDQKVHNYVVMHVTQDPHALTHITVYTRISCTLNQSLELFDDFRRVRSPDDRSVLQTWHTLELTSNSVSSQLPV